MPLLTEEFRQQQLERGRRSFWYFLTAICGQVFEDENGNPTYCDLHRDLCHFLEGRTPHHPWSRALVCAFRGAVKSTIATSMYALWRCLYIENFSALIISNSADNARDKHFLPIIDLLTSHRRSEYIRWLFAHRFPPGMEGTTSEHLSLVRTSAFAEFAISCKGVDSKLEGIHPGLICHSRGTPVFDGEFRGPVESHPSFSRSVTGEGVVVVVWGLPFPEVVTPEHRYWTRRIEYNKPGRWFAQEWCRASELDDRTWIGYPIDQAVRPVDSCPMVDVWESSPIIRRDEKGRITETGPASYAPWRPPEFSDPEWWWFFGLWWGDGHVAGKYQVGITSSDEKITDRVSSLLARHGIAWSRAEKPGCHQVIFSRAWLNRWLRTWRSGNACKQPPTWVERIELSLQERLLEGYIDADGYPGIKDGKETRITSVFLPGLLCLRRICARIGKVATIRLGPPPGDVVIRGVKATARRRYDLRISGRNQRYSYYQTFIADGHLWSRVKSVSSVGSAEFCPINTASRDYLTAFGRSHNCLDDPEGADSEKGGVASEAAWSAYEKCIPMAFPPKRSQILLVGTPHGPRPIVYRIRDRDNWQSEADNARTSFKIWWREILDEHGKSRWPAVFPMWHIETLRKDTSVWDTQYMLRRRAGVTTLFEAEAIKEGLWRHLTPERAILAYRGFEWDPDAVDEKTGYVIPEAVETTVNLRELRYYIHFDPLHKEEAAKRTRGLKHIRPTKAAIVVVGVAPDFHAFVLECWLADADLHKQVSELFRLYRKWCPYQVTWEPIGAQAWLKNYVEVQERSRPDFGAPRSLGHILPADATLPRLSARLVEDEKGISTKEWVHRELLSPWINQGVLHLHHSQEQLLWQLEHAMEELAEVDLLDALAQGPRVWKAPVSEESERRFLERRRFVNLFVAKDKANKVTGFRDRGWR